MKNHIPSFIFLTTIITLLRPFNSSLCDGIFNNIANAKLIQSASIVPTDGNYVFTNLGTGETVQHDRRNDVPNIYTSGDKSQLPSAHHPHRHPRPRSPETDDDDELAVAPLELRSHRTRTKWISIRTTATSSDPKCISAQWGYHTEGGADHAGTLYECVVDPLNLEATLEKPKQWWLLMPVEAAKKLNTGQTLDLKNEILSHNKAMKMKEAPMITRLVDEQQGGHGSSSLDTLETPFWNAKTNRIENFPSGPSSDKNKRSYHLSVERSRAHQAGLVRNVQLENSLSSTPLVNSTSDSLLAPQALHLSQDEPNRDNGADAFNNIDTSPLNKVLRRSSIKHPHHRHSKPASKTFQDRKEAQKPSSDTLGPFYVVSVDHLYVS